MEEKVESQIALIPNWSENILQRNLSHAKIEFGGLVLGLLQTVRKYDKTRHEPDRLLSVTVLSV